MSWTPPKDDYNPLATMQNLPIKTTVPLFEESRDQKDSRMEWWREARFGMFIHWGLYSIPASEWKGSDGHGEWIRDTAQIPLEVYDRFAQQFNPVKFDAQTWVKLAKDAGMKYIVLRSILPTWVGFLFRTQSAFHLSANRRRAGTPSFCWRLV